MANAAHTVEHLVHAMEKHEAADGDPQHEFAGILEFGAPVVSGGLRGAPHGSHSSEHRAAAIGGFEREARIREAPEGSVTARLPRSLRVPIRVRDHRAEWQKHR